ncbi:MAG: type II toxin-antitoxin system HicB family antitoxin [Christensenellales bacterium]
MKTYVYPAVIYENKDGTYYASIIDLNLLAVGDTEQDAFIQARNSLKSYFELSARFDTEVPEPSDFKLIKSKYPKQTVVMLDVLVNESDQIPTKEDQKYKDFMKLFFDEGE